MKAKPDQTADPPVVEGADAVSEVSDGGSD
jgi:hypothetical protein